MPLEPHAGHDVWVARSGATPKTLLMHCTLARYETLVPLATALGVDWCAFDLPGHGRSADWPGLQHDGQTDFHSAVCDVALDLCDGPTHLIAHSFSATVALRMAILRPDLVSRLILIEPVFFAFAKGTTAFDIYAASMARIDAAIRAGDTMKAARLFHDDWGGGAWDATPSGAQASMAKRMPLVMASGPAIFDDIHNIVRNPALGAMTDPVTLIRGSDSHIVIPDIHAALCAAMPHATDHVIAGAGHMVPITHVAQVAALIA